MVLDPMTSRYVAGFSSDKLYQFRYREDGEVFSMRLRDASPHMNVYGLRFKDPLETLRS